MSIDRFLSDIRKRGGMASSNNFVVRFSGDNIPIWRKDLQDDFLEVACDEAQLPNVNTATGTQTGLYTGLGSVDYAHTKIFTEVQLGFMLDADLTALKFLNAWYGYVFDESPNIDGVGNNRLVENRSVRLNYKDDYTGTIEITKTEIGPKSPTERESITYVLEKAFPYAVDAIPLQYGSTQILKVTAQFKYQRHYTIDKSINLRYKSNDIGTGNTLVDGTFLSD